MTVKEKVVHALQGLDETELREVAEYVAFLKFRERQQKVAMLHEAGVAALYAEFAEDDRSLAEAGMDDYADQLAAEDSR